MVELSHTLHAWQTDGGQEPCRDNYGIADSRALMDGGMYGGSREMGGGSGLGSSRGLRDGRVLAGSHALVRGRVSVGR